MTAARRSARLLAAALALLLAGPVGADAVTVAELVRALKDAGADEARLIEKFPTEIKESRPEFLGGAVYLEVLVRHPHHPHLLRFVHQPGKGLYRLQLGAEEFERLRADVRLAVKGPESALEYARWRLVLGGGPAFWLVAAPEDVPFAPARKDDAAGAERIARARAALAPKIAPPAARADGADFVVTQCAVRGRSLVRYEARVAADGGCSFSAETLVEDLPVVEVTGDD